nr:udp-d-xylose:l-fucose alpha-1,3-d-xylosyltransferase mgp4 [Quercus suber]
MWCGHSRKGRGSRTGLLTSLQFGSNPNQFHMYRDSSILHPEGHVTYSIFWRSIMAAKETIEKGLRWIVGNGRKVDIWRDRWLPTPDSFKVISPQRQNWNLEKVAQLIDSETGTWKAGLVKPLNHSHDLPPPGKKGRPYICSCMIFLRPTSGAKLVMKKWIEELQSQPWSKAKKANDQPGFNWALNKTAGEVDLYLLPQAAFPTGGLYFKNKTWVQETKGMHVIIHNNYITAKHYCALMDSSRIEKEYQAFYGADISNSLVRSS